MKQKGAQAVEFALVLPFFILILFLVLDFGMLVYNKAIITNASREGANGECFFGHLLGGEWTQLEEFAVNRIVNGDTSDTPPEGWEESED